MISRDSLIEKMATLLDNALVQPSINFSYTDKVDLVLLQTEIFEVCPDPKKFIFKNEQVIALKALYLQLSIQDQSFFVEFLLKRIKGNFDYEIAKTAFNTLCHLGFFSKVFPLIKKEILKFTNARKYSVILNLYSEFLKYEWNNYSLDELRQIKLWVEESFNENKAIGKKIELYGYVDVKNVFYKLARQINILLTKAFKDQIFSGYNPEINEDQKKLTQEFTRYGFSDDLNITLQKIDDKFTNASDNFDYKSCMDLIRSFTERLYQSISISIDNTLGRKVKVTDSEEVAKFFLSKNLLSRNQADLLVSLRHFLSNEASHKLKSKQEDARLTRNITVEYSLFLMKRLETRQTE